MSISTNKSSLPAATPQADSSRRSQGRIWSGSASRSRRLWLLSCALFYLVILAWYLYAVRTQPFPGPATDPLRLFGMLAFCLVLVTAAYTLRRRFVRSLPGKVQDWLWMHTWVGITAVLIAFLHENFAFILHDYCQNLSCLTQNDGGASALFALIFLVASGIVGRLLDNWQAHIISRDASANGVGIIRAIEERLLELEFTVERLCAGKSDPFQEYCLQAIEQDSLTSGEAIVSSLVAKEQADFRQAYQTLLAHAQLLQSLQRQKRARVIIKTWRSIHMVLAVIAVLIMLYHGLMELFSSVLPH